MLSTYGKLTVLAIWIIYILISLYGLSGVTVDFKTTYFIKQDHFINDYFTKMDLYFKQGDSINIIFDNKEGVDFSTREN